MYLYVKKQFKPPCCLPCGTSVIKALLSGWNTSSLTISLSPLVFSAIHTCHWQNLVVQCNFKTTMCILFLGQSHCMKFQPSTALTRTKWISFLKVALLSVLSASSSHFFQHRISRLRALHTAWLSPPAWHPVCYSPFLWPPCLQTQIKTGSLVEQVQ